MPGDQVVGACGTSARATAMMAFTLIAVGRRASIQVATGPAQLDSARV